MFTPLGGGYVSVFYIYVTVYNGLLQPVYCVKSQGHHYHNKFIVLESRPSLPQQVYCVRVKAITTTTKQVYCVRVEAITTTTSLLLELRPSLPPYHFTLSTSLGFIVKVQKPNLVFGAYEPPGPPAGPPRC
jgi:hypothetical protein